MASERKTSAVTPAQEKPAIGLNKDIVLVGEKCKKVCYKFSLAIIFQYRSRTEQELVSADPDQRNWKGICIALLVIATVCSLIVAAIFLLTPEIESRRVRNPRFSLEEVINGQAKPRTFNGSWISENELIFRDFYATLVIYNVETKTKTNLMANTTFRQLNAYDYRISADRKFVLLLSEKRKIYKYSYTAKYNVYDLKSQAEYTKSTTINNQRLQLVTWGPSGNQLVYVQNNNIYYLPSVEHRTSQSQLTQNGISGFIYNGVPDWLYEHEIFHSNKAVWWSKDGTKLCYISFNDTAVTPYEYAVYGSYKNSNNIYPNVLRISYPKAGQTIPTVSLWIADLNQSNLIPQQIHPPEDYKDIEHYITTVSWIDNTTLSVIWMKRSQNSSIVSICRQENNWKCEKNFQEDSVANGWVEMIEAPLFTSDRENYFLRLPFPDEDAGSFHHVTRINVKSGKKDFLTHGESDVTKLLAYDKENKTIYFIKTLANKPGERHVASISETTGNISKKETCLTCDMDYECLYNNAIFSHNAKYYILECLGPGVPKIQIRSAVENNLVQTLDRNEHMREFMSIRALPQIRTFQVPLKKNYKADVRMFLPPGLSDSELVKYPMLIHADGSPGSQTVSEMFQLNWATYLSSKKNYIYVWIDGRVSGFQGENRIHQLYGQLGTVEVEDYITTTKYLKDNLPFINSNNTAIWGWGYGGYIAALSLIQENSMFQCAVSVAPVTSWKYHNAVYAERYMQLPESTSYIGYEKSDLSTKAHSFMGKKFLLIHGTADEIIHVQHSMMFMKALTESGVMYHSQLYPDEDHHLTNVKFHFYSTMEDFLEQCYRSEITVSDKQTS